MKSKQKYGVGASTQQKSEKIASEMRSIPENLRNLTRKDPQTVSPPARLMRTCNTFAQQVDLATEFHKEGVNLRHLSAVHAICEQPTVRHLLEMEMLKRSTKVQLRERLRNAVGRKQGMDSSKRSF